MRVEKTATIVATLGPASLNAARQLRQAGASVFRLNASHMTPQELARTAATLRADLPDCPLVVDLRGAKMRVGEFGELPVRAGAAVCFSLSGSEGTIPLPHREIYEAVAIGETIGCDDDRLRFRVTKVRAGWLETASISNGTLRPRKGVNVIEHPVVLKDLCPMDVECIRNVAQLPEIAFAFSFMRDGSEAAWVRKRAPACRIIGKIERREAAARVSRISRAVDELWICRGDLGAQLGQGAMARWISSYLPRRAPCPVFMAGQVLEHLTHHSLPTRAEVCHLYDLVRRGYTGFVLSDETAIGSDPEGAVRTLRSLLNEFMISPRPSSKRGR